MAGCADGWPGVNLYPDADRQIRATSRRRAIPQPPNETQRNKAIGFCIEASVRDLAVDEHRVRRAGRVPGGRRRAACCHQGALGADRQARRGQRRRPSSCSWAGCHCSSLSTWAGALMHDNMLWYTRTPWRRRAEGGASAMVRPGNTRHMRWGVELPRRRDLWLAVPDLAFCGALSRIERRTTCCRTTPGSRRGCTQAVRGLALR